MTRESIREYTEPVRGRYLRAWKEDKAQILVEFTLVTGCHRKAAIHLLHLGNQPRRNKKRSDPRQYRPAVAGKLRVAQEAPDACHPKPCIHFCQSYLEFAEVKEVDVGNPCRHQYHAPVKRLRASRVVLKVSYFSGHLEKVTSLPLALLSR